MDPLERDPAPSDVRPADRPPVPEGVPMSPAGATPPAAAEPPAATVSPAPVAPSAPVAPPHRPRRRLLLLRCVLALIACDAALILGAYAYAILGTLWGTFGGEASDNLMMIVGEGAGALAAIVFLLLLGGRKIMRLTRSDLLLGLRESRYALALAGVLCAVSVSSTLSGGTPLLPDWPLQLLVTLALCLCVGVVEEGMYRGLLMGGLLERMGGSRKGVMRAMLISSAVFGAAHLTFVESLDAITGLQLALKFLQAGMLGFFFAGLALRTRGPWPGALTHALWDFLLMSSSALFEKNIEVEYVSTGEDAVWLIGYYAFIVLLQVPLVLGAMRAYREAPSPYCGWLHKGLPAGAGSEVPVVPAETPVAPVGDVPAETPVAPVGEVPAEAPVASVAPTPPVVGTDADRPPRPEEFVPPVDERL